MESDRSGWAVGFAAFAAVMLMMVGVFHFLAGLAGVANDGVYTATANWIFKLNTTGWGWIHMIGGVLLVLAGLSILKGHMYGRIIGVAAAAGSAIANFAWLGYQPFWSITMIAIDVAIIWALTVHGRDIAGPSM